MGLAEIYVDATTKRKFPSENTFQGIWNEWLWGTDCNEMIDEKCGDMNHMHILGIFLALIESMMHDNGEVDQDTMEDLLPDIPLVHLHNKAISDYSLRELTNQVECMQLSWGQVLSHGDFQMYYKVLKKLFARFGHIIHRAYPNVDNNTVLDDPQYITQIPSTTGLFITTRKYIRQMVCVFLALFRTIYIISSAEIVAEVSEEDNTLIKSAFKTHHIESSSDFFNSLQQVICLAPGMRLVYRTNFAGMYNDISQVVYFHHPKFAKQPQLKLSDILQSSVNTLPLMTQLFPQIQVYYDDDSHLPYLSKHSTAGHSIEESIGLDIDAFVQKNIDKENEQALLLKQMEKGVHVLDEEVDERDLSHEESKIIMKDSDRYGWLICCSNVFLIDSQQNKIFSSCDNSLVPLIAQMLRDAPSTIGAALREGFQEELNPLLNKSIKIDLGTAHGHVCLL